MAKNDDEQPNVSTKMDTFEGRLSTLESTMEFVVQKLKKISLRLDDRYLTDGTHRSGLDRPKNNPPPLPLPSLGNSLLPPPPLSVNSRPQPTPLNQPPPIQPPPVQPPPLLSPSYQPPSYPPYPNQPLIYHPYQYPMPPNYPLRYSQTDDFSDEFNSPAYQYDDFGDDSFAYGRRGRFANPNSNRRGGFPNPNREARVWKEDT